MAGVSRASYPPEPALTGRDLDLVNLVARFKQLTATHAHALLFDELSSRTPYDRALKRLVISGYLLRIERRLVGGSRGGSGQYVYALGRRGHWLTRDDGRYYPARHVDPHRLAIADAYLTVKQMERAGLLAILGYSTEPDSWTTVAGTAIRPDLFLDLAYSTGERRLVWLEVDLGSEGQRQLRGKLEAYWRAYDDVDAAQWPVWPQVIWAVADDERAKELTWLIGQLKREARALFEVTTLAKLSVSLLR